MKGEDFARISESFRIRYGGFEATGLPAIVCAVGIVVIAAGIANLLRNNAEAALRAFIFARGSARAQASESRSDPHGEARRTVS